MNDYHPPNPGGLTRRRACGAGALLLALPIAPMAAWADVATWEFYEPRPRQFSRLRKVPDTMAIEFAGQRIDDDAWPRLSEAQQAIVRQAQKQPLAAGDEPPYPTAGLRPLIERLHRVRGPANAPLRLHLSVGALGDIEGLATDVAVPGPFLNELLQTLVSSGFKPARCNGEACAGTLTLDLVYLGG